MLLMVTDDTTSLSYWLNWRFLLSAIFVLTPMSIALYLIWKYERPKLSHLESDRVVKGLRSGILRNEDAWSPCINKIPPVFLLVYRVLAFCLLLAAVTCITVDTVGIFLYYTQWTFTLVAIYFGFGSLLSIYGCCQQNKTNDLVAVDTERGIYVPIACDANTNGVKIKDSSYNGKPDTSQVAGLWVYLYQVLFQMAAGAVILTDIVYWCVIFPFLAINYYEMSFLTVLSHSLNAVLLIGDAVLNSLPFPWFGIVYFILWTGFYVIFQWIFHACIPTWWPYPFLDLSQRYAPVWYLVVTLLHFPCYGIFTLIMELKQYVLSRWFSEFFLRHK